MHPAARPALLILLLACVRPAWPAGPGPLLLVHGGAGAISRDEMTGEREARFRSGLETALKAGYAVLSAGGGAMEAVTAAIVVMEDDEMFNAGRGAVFTWEGRNEMDAAVMDGSDRTTGAVAGVRLVRNPILLAREVMRHSPHVLLTGTGAEEFALGRQIEMRPPDYFHTRHRWQQLLDLREREDAPAPVADRLGTVGAVALDVHGNLAAGTSTGGITGKRWGRVGDSPLVGAGTYADNRSCAVSATGHGEYFIRALVAYDICARVRYLGADLGEAARQIVMVELADLGGAGGVISLDASGDYAAVFNTAGMYRGLIDRHGAARTAIFGDERL